MSQKKRTVCTTANPKRPLSHRGDRTPLWKIDWHHSGSGSWNTTTLSTGRTSSGWTRAPHPAEDCSSICLLTSTLEASAHDETTEGKVTLTLTSPPSLSDRFQLHWRLICSMTETVCGQHPLHPPLPCTSVFVLLPIASKYGVCGMWPVANVSSDRRLALRSSASPELTIMAAEKLVLKVGNPLRWSELRLVGECRVLWALGGETAKRDFKPSFCNCGVPSHTRHLSLNLIYFPLTL